ncbi:uncharacterized protein LOC118193810 [Stegodyphus dumicola]|uniref:uncharacterized protein LOC118193810 n=1 Tax=Stegodyphus dumicola TaxID=202533 RepID=UPI0015AAD58F|nr:uncharacterized protein LOC118193810 [Stegodyphus dumicola]
MECASNQSERKEHYDQSSDYIKSEPEVDANSASQKDPDCDENTVPIKMNQLNMPTSNYVPQCKIDFRSKCTDDSNDTSKVETNHSGDQKQTGLTWSVLRHRQLSGDALRNCDKSNSCVIEHSGCDKLQLDGQIDSQENPVDFNTMAKPKRNIKDRSFPLSLMRPITKISDKKSEILPQPLFSHGNKNDLSRQHIVQRTARDKFQNMRTNKDKLDDKSKKLTNDVLDMNNPLSEISQIKTEESIQEWLARIGESANNTWPDDKEKKDKSQRFPPWSLENIIDVRENSNTVQLKQRNNHETDNLFLDKSTQHSTEMCRNRPCQNRKEQQEFEEINYCVKTSTSEDIDANRLLCNASKASPANVPMVVMQCSRLHSHIGCKPPFQQTSLPMGTLVTALYQESDWLYVQTPHGVEGFVTASNCLPIGKISDPAQTSRRPWEPCDFPIQSSMRNNCEFGRQQGSYIQAKLPTNNCKQAVPYVSTVKMKTNFYSDRYFSHTFKSKDSIKTAKTVTDILRSSPDTKVSNQLQDFH